MSREELSLFSYEILGLIGREGAGPHDLRQMVRRGRMVEWAGESQYYAEPKRLERLGYLRSTKEPGKTRERTVYHLTEKGLDALRAWSRTPVSVGPVKSEALTRMLIADLVGEEPTRESIATIRNDVACSRPSSTRWRPTPTRSPTGASTCSSRSSTCAACSQLHLDWVDEVEREFIGH